MEHSTSNKSNFSADAKQIICDLGKKESYSKLEPIDLSMAMAKILKREKSRWAE